MKNGAESQAVIEVSYVRNVRGRAMLPDSTVPMAIRVFMQSDQPIGGFVIEKCNQFVYTKIQAFI